MKKCNCSDDCRIDESGAAVIEQENSCGEEYACGCSHGEDGITTLRQDVIAMIVSAALAVGALFIPEGIYRTLLFAAAILTAGAPVFWQGIKNIAKLNLDEMALLTVAVAAASVIGELPEAMMVTLLFRVGEMLEGLAVSRSRREVEAVTKIIPDNANLLSADGMTRIVSAKTLQVGDRIRIKSGERIPVDCVILSGASSVDSSSLTGESAPREAQAGDGLLSGMVNLGGVLTCEAVSTFDHSTASKIVRMVKESAAKKGKAERLISRFARVYTPIVIAMAVLVAILPPLLHFGTFTQWIGRALVFLVASCPCALVIATPLAFFAGIGGASKQGILIKGSKYMEALAKTGRVVFDKTGTLTTGMLAVDTVTAANGYSRDEVLLLAAVCENGSNHPVAKAVVAAGPKELPQAESCEELTAYGMRAVIAGDEALCGSARLMERFSVDISALPSVNVYIAKNGVAIGAISVFDTPREDAAGTISQLKAMGVSHTAMLTGDSIGAAKKTAALTGIDETFACLLPQDKVEQFMRMQEETSGSTIFVGDGINDSPVIAAADAGVAMGISSDAAIEAADVVLLSDRLSSLPQAIRIARRTTRLARFNIAFALIIKAAVLILAFFGFANMWLAVFADVGVAILSVLNAARALRFR